MKQQAQSELHKEQLKPVRIDKGFPGDENEHIPTLIHENDDTDMDFQLK